MKEYVCPNCRNPIYDEEALLCHFCGESLQRASKGALGKIRYSGPHMIWVFGVVVVILAFVLLYIAF